MPELSRGSRLLKRCGLPDLYRECYLFLKAVIVLSLKLSSMPPRLTLIVLSFAQSELQRDYVVATSAISAIATGLMGLLGEFDETV